jgi:putative molybdopterin biosynthesis protein
VIFGSHDPALEMLSTRINVDSASPELAAYPIGSLDGLTALRQGLCQLSGCHLFDPVDGEYNTSYVRHFFPGQSMHMVTLAHREQGLIVASGNPHGIKDIADLSRDEIIFVNRKRGSGTRLWLDQQIDKLRLDTNEIQGYEAEVNTHVQVAETVLTGHADVGLAVLAAAQNTGLEFIPLFEERFDLVLHHEDVNNPVFSPLLEALNLGRTKNQISALAGYRTTDTGNSIQIA